MALMFVKPERLQERIQIIKIYHELLDLNTEFSNEFKLLKNVRDVENTTNTPKNTWDYYGCNRKFWKKAKFVFFSTFFGIEHSTKVITTEFHNIELSHVHFEQDNVLCHTNNEIIDLICKKIPNCVFFLRDDHNSPPRSCDLKLCYCFLWGHLEKEALHQRLSWGYSICPCPESKFFMYSITFKFLIRRTDSGESPVVVMRFVFSFYHRYVAKHRVGCFKI